MLRTVTITGADDSITPEELLILSNKYPFAEWAILFSRRRQDSPRYPSLQWVNELMEVKQLRPHIKLSCHLCGGYVREIFQGNGETIKKEFAGIWQHFDRVQLNTAQKYVACNPPAFMELLKLYPDKEFIFQFDKVNRLPANLAVATAGVKASVLFDLSNGNGILPNDWPQPLENIKCGYAGGMGPDNLERQIELIKAATRKTNTWVDMETKVRTEPQNPGPLSGSYFDLKKVERCLKAAEKYIDFVSEKA